MNRSLPPVRRGVVSMMAMLYMILFATLAVGFVAMVQSATQVSHNDQRGGRALLAAESGMGFLRYHLWALDIDHYTPPEQLFDRVYEQLQARLDATPNLQGGSIGREGDVIYVPAGGGFIAADDSGASFRATITRQGKELVASVIGRHGQAEASRAIQLTYGIFERPSAIFDYGVASKSRITMIGNTSIIGQPDPASGSVLSTSSADYPLSMGNSCSISGEVSFTNPDAWVDAKGGSIINNERGESAWHDNIHFVDEPDFPVIDTSDFVPYATNLITGSNPPGKYFENIRIKAGTNPSFQGGTEIKGVIYIEAPNNVTFAGNCKITGIIVAESMPPGQWPDSKGTWETNSIDFRGTVTATGVQNLPDEGAFAGLAQLDGAMILAEHFSVKFGGNAGTASGVSGSIIASAVDVYGSVDCVVDGSVINMDNSLVNFRGNASVTIRSRGTVEQPHGVFFGSRYEPLPGSYLEVTQ